MDSSRRKRGPAWFRIILLSTTAFAIDFAFSVEAAYSLPAILKTGLDEKYATVLWAIGPVLSVLFQGCLGSASDRCKCSWGRRRPFILGLAIVVCICAGLFPYGELLSDNVFHLSGNVHRAFVIAFTAITFIGFDFSLGMLPTPVRAYLLDSVPPEKSERGNSIYASMINVGSTVGAVIACIPWKKLGLGEDDILGVQVKVLFGITVAVVIIAQLFTLCSVKERRHLTDQDPFIVHKESSSVIKLVQIDHSRDNQNSPDVKDAVSAEIADSTNSGVTNEFSEQDLSEGTEESCPADGRDNQNSTDTEDLAVVSVEMSNSGAKNDLGEASSSDQPVNGENVEQHADFEVSSEGNLLVEESSNESGTFQTKCRCFGLKPSSCFEDIVGSIYGTFLFVKYMSFTYLRLWVLVCFSWFAYIAMNGFFTTFVGEVVYGGSPLSEDKEQKDNFDEGVIVGSVALAVQCFVALVYSLASEWITKCFGLRPVVIGAHVAFLVTCGVTVLYPTVLTAMVINVVVGVYFALLVNFPFALISYYKDSGLLLRKPWLRESDTKGKAVAFILMGVSLSQLVLGLSMGFIISAFGTTRIVLVVALLGECFATVSALFLTTKPASCDHQWCSWKPLVKCFRRLIHRETQDKNHQVQAKNETSEV